MIESTQTHTLEQQGRLAWAPALANGAAILALIGLVGSVDDPDFALTGLWPALGLLALGLAAGLSSLGLFHDWARHFTEQVAHHIDRRRSVAEIERYRALPALPFDLDTGEAIFGSRESAVKAMRDTWASNVRVASEYQTFYRAEVARIDMRLDELMPVLVQLGARAVLWGKLSVALCALAFLWIVIAHELGIFRLTHA